MIKKRELKHYLKYIKILCDDNATPEYTAITKIKEIVLIIEKHMNNKI